MALALGAVAQHPVGHAGLAYTEIEAAAIGVFLGGLLCQRLDLSGGEFAHFDLVAFEPIKTGCPPLFVC